MIIYVDNLFEKDIEHLPDGSLKTRILGMYMGYGADFDFLDFWLQKENENTTAVISRFEGESWLLASQDANWEELGEFLKVIAPDVLTDSKTAESLGVAPQNKFFEVCKEAARQGNDVPNPPVKQICDMLMSGADGDIEIPNKDEWYADVSHRFRHGIARASVTQNAVALAGIVTKDAALISGVATKRQARGKGEGSAVLTNLCELLYPRKIYAEATDGAVGFYLKNGFTKSAELCRCKIYNKE
ncbi:MAG: GNAT family N-acetyltransferase [Clostridia bacterium]|nr:GNAT family N-acetyltransferase [Clostridia bacterium]